LNIVYIGCHQQTRSMFAQRGAGELAALAAWGEQHGVVLYGIKATTTEHAGFAFVATNELAAGSIVISTPRNLLFGVARYSFAHLDIAAAASTKALQMRKEVSAARRGAGSRVFSAGADAAPRTERVPR
jgi:hypothetical protein